jgi:hypothetical protein
LSSKIRFCRYAQTFVKYDLIKARFQPKVPLPAA